MPKYEFIFTQPNNGITSGKAQLDRITRRFLLYTILLQTDNMLASQSSDDNQNQSIADIISQPTPQLDHRTSIVAPFEQETADDAEFQESEDFLLLLPFERMYARFREHCFNLTLEYLKNPTSSHFCRTQ
jgi:hypothetical protein